MKLLIILCLLWLFPFIITSYFNHPAIDDYWNANVVQSHGVAGAVSYFYQTVSARYASNLIMSFCNTLPTGKVWMFKIWPVVTIIFLFVSFYFFYQSVFSKSATRQQIIGCSLLFVVLHISNMRSLFEGLYWMSSTICYQLAIGFFVINIGAIVKDIRHPSLLTKLLAIVSCFILPGTVEIIIPIYLLTLFLILYFADKLHYHKPLIICCLLIVSIISIFVIFSKGNISRVENNSTSYNPNLLTALFYSARAVGYYSIIWLLNPLNVFAFILLATSGIKISGRWFFAIKKRQAALLYACFIFLSIAVYMPLHLFESSIPFPRVTSLFFLLFFHGCLFTGWHLHFCNFSIIKKVNYLLHLKYVRTASFIFFFVCALTTKNFVFVCRDLYSGTAMKYDQECYERYSLIRSCKTDTCFVPAHKYWPYFAQSTEKETSVQNPFVHVNTYFRKIILFQQPSN